jgi:hypothetical protein
VQSTTASSAAVAEAERLRAERAGVDEASRVAREAQVLSFRSPEHAHSLARTLARVMSSSSLSPSSSPMGDNEGGACVWRVGLWVRGGCAWHVQEMGNAVAAQAQQEAADAVAQAKTEAEKVEELEMVCCLTSHHIRSSKTAVQSRIVYVGMRLTRQPLVCDADGGGAVRQCYRAGGCCRRAATVAQSGRNARARPRRKTSIDGGDGHAENAGSGQRNLTTSLGQEKVMSYASDVIKSCSRISFG